MFEPGPEDGGDLYEVGVASTLLQVKLVFFPHLHKNDCRCQLVKCTVTLGGVVMNKHNIAVEQSHTQANLLS